MSRAILVLLLSLASSARAQTGAPAGAGAAAAPVPGAGSTAAAGAASADGGARADAAAIEGDATEAGHTPGESAQVAAGPGAVQTQAAETQAADDQAAEAQAADAQAAETQAADAQRAPRACDRASRQLGAATAPLLDGMLGVPRRACFRDEVAIAGDASLIADPANFYGNIRVGARVSGSLRIEDLAELFASFEVLRWQSLVSAVSTSYLGLGYLTVGGSVRYYDQDGRRWVAWSRLVLPTTSGLDQRSQPLALDLGSTGEWSAHPNLRLHTWLSVLGSVGLSDIAPAQPRGGLRVGGGADWIPWNWLSFQLEVQAGFGYRDALDFVALSGGARLGLGDRIGIDLSVLWPFLGAQRELLAAQVGLSARLD